LFNRKGGNFLNDVSEIFRSGGIQMDMAKYNYKLENRAERKIKNGGNRVYIILDGVTKLVLYFRKDARDVRMEFPSCKIIRSRKMKYNEMLAVAESGYSRYARKLQYHRMI